MVPRLAGGAADAWPRCRPEGTWLYDRIEVYRLSGDGYGPPTLAGAGETMWPTRLEGLAVEVDDVLRPLR